MNRTGQLALTVSRTELCKTIDWVQDLRGWFDRTYEKPAREALLKLIERARQSAQAPLNQLNRST